jgi:hypothetical protein
MRKMSNNHVDYTDSDKWKKRAAERKKNNNWITCNGQAVIFYPPVLSKSDIEAGKLEKLYTPKAIGFTETVIFLLFENNVQLMLPTDRCVIVDPSATALMRPEGNPVYNGIEVNEDEHIQTILYNAYLDNWLEAPIKTDNTKEENNE